MPETPRPALTRVAVLIPTYNEAENLPGVVERVRSVTPAVDVVVPGCPPTPLDLLHGILTAVARQK